MNHNAGAKTAMSNIVMSVTVMVTLLFLMPLFQYTPNVILGAIIVTAVVGLIDVPAAYHIWKVDKYDFLVLVCAFLGVIFISVQEGLAIAVSSHQPEFLLLYAVYVIKMTNIVFDDVNRLEYRFSRLCCKLLGRGQLFWEIYQGQIYLETCSITRIQQQLSLVSSL